MSTADEPRRWSIGVGETGNYIHGVVALPLHEPVEVVEASAYDAAIERASRLRERVEASQERLIRGDRSDVSAIVGARLDAYEDVLVWIDDLARPEGAAPSTTEIPSPGSADAGTADGSNTSPENGVSQSPDGLAQLRARAVRCRDAMREATEGLSPEGARTLVTQAEVYEVVRIWCDELGAAAASYVETGEDGGGHPAVDSGFVVDLSAAIGLAPGTEELDDGGCDRLAENLAKWLDEYWGAPLASFARRSTAPLDGLGGEGEAAAKIVSDHLLSMRREIQGKIDALEPRHHQQIAALQWVLGLLPLDATAPPASPVPSSPEGPCGEHEDTDVDCATCTATPFDPPPSSPEEGEGREERERMARRLDSAMRQVAEVRKSHPEVLLGDAALALADARELLVPLWPPAPGGECA